MPQLVDRPLPVAQAGLVPPPCLVPTATALSAVLAPSTDAVPMASIESVNRLAALHPAAKTRNACASKVLHRTTVDLPALDQNGNAIGSRRRNAAIADRLLVPTKSGIATSALAEVPISDLVPCSLRTVLRLCLHQTCTTVTCTAMQGIETRDPLKWLAPTLLELPQQLLATSRSLA